MRRVRRVASEDGEAKSRGAAEGDLALLLGGIVDGLGRCLDVVGRAGGGLGGVAAGGGAVPGAVSGIFESAARLGEGADAASAGRDGGGAAGGARLLEADLGGHHVGDLAAVSAVGGRGDRALGGRLELRARGRVRGERGVVAIDVPTHAVRAGLVRPAGGGAGGGAAVTGVAGRGARCPGFLSAPVLGEREALHRLAAVLRHVDVRWINRAISGGGVPTRASGRARGGARTRTVEETRKNATRGRSVKMYDAVEDDAREGVRTERGASDVSVGKRAVDVAKSRTIDGRFTSTRAQPRSGDFAEGDGGVRIGEVVARGARIAQHEKLRLLVYMRVGAVRSRVPRLAR